MTAMPVLALAGTYFFLNERFSMQLFNGDGLGSAWFSNVSVAVVAVVGLMTWWGRFKEKGSTGLDTFAICCFGAAITLVIAIQTFQDLNQTNSLDIALVFAPYVAALFLARGNAAEILHPVVSDLSHTA